MYIPANNSSGNLIWLFAQSSSVVVSKATTRFSSVSADTKHVPTSILLKYNGRTNFERFLSKDELAKTIKELQGEVINLEKLKKAGNITTEQVQYARQLRTDINNAERLIQITI